MNAKEHAVSIVERLRRAGFQAYLVGGCVRDLLLGREPADFDVSTDAAPDQVMTIFPETYAVGAQFGVVLVPLHEEDAASIPKASVVEVATFRSDIGYSDGRHPDQVRFSKDPSEDVRRRDFTINGLLLDPITNQVLDFVDGREDLEGRIIRTIGNPEQRFAEDKLRMLRAVRFAARFDYTVEPATLTAIQKLVAQIHQVSRERVRDEFTKILTEGHARSAFLLLDQTGLLRELLPEIEAMKGVEQPPQFHPEGDVFVHTLLLLKHLPHPCPPTLAWGALLHDVGKLEELCYERSIGYSTEGQLLGHIVMELETVAKAMESIPGFPDKLKTVVQHMLISHHGEYEFGSPKLPMIREALVFHYMDDMDSKLAAIRAAMAIDGGDPEWSAFSGALGRKFLRLEKFLEEKAPEKARNASENGKAAIEPPKTLFETPS
jgi:tRNA nucleotidyltransferase/poly(A) polymerase